MFTASKRLAVARPTLQLVASIWAVIVLWQVRSRLGQGFVNLIVPLLRPYLPHAFARFIVAKSVRFHASSVIHSMPFAPAVDTFTLSKSAREVLNLNSLAVNKDAHSMNST